MASTIVLASSLSIGIASASGAIAWVPLILSWIVTTGALRYHYIVIGHAASHGTFHRSRWINRLVGELTSTFALTISFDHYRRDHARFHHSKRLATPRDPDVRSLLAWKFTPGKSIHHYRRRLLMTLLSPRFHLGYAWSRLHSNLIMPPLYRKLMTLAWIGGLAAAVSIAQAWPPFLLAFGVPVLFGFSGSALLQFLSEHRWLMLESDPQARHGRLTFGRFLGDPLAEDSSLGERIRWAARVAFVHLPVRIAVLVGDLPQHDLHHRAPRSAWWDGAFARQDAAMATRNDAFPFEDRWGSLLDHIDQVFEGWAARGPLTEIESRELAQPLAE